MYDFNHERNALSDITNFIAQEIYVLAIREKFPTEFNSILEMTKVINDKLNFIMNEYNEETIFNDITNESINNIITGENSDKFIEECDNYIDSHFSFHLSVDDNNTEFLNYINTLKVKIQTILKDILNTYDAPPLNITHKYPPYVLCLNQDYLSSLIYYYRKEYIPETITTPQECTISYINPHIK